jgi:hypothetical protein
MYFFNIQFDIIPESMIINYPVHSYNLFIIIYAFQSIPTDDSSNKWDCKTRCYESNFYLAASDMAEPVLFVFDKNASQYISYRVTFTNRWGSYGIFFMWEVKFFSASTYSKNSGISYDSIPPWKWISVLSKFNPYILAEWRIQALLLP